MDIRFLIVGAPFLIAFFYTLFWLKKWGAFNSTNNNLPKNISLKNILSSPRKLQPVTVGG